MSTVLIVWRQQHRKNVEQAQGKEYNQHLLFPPIGKVFLEWMTTNLSYLNCWLKKIIILGESRQASIEHFRWSYSMFLFKCGLVFLGTMIPGRFQAYFTSVRCSSTSQEDHDPDRWYISAHKIAESLGEEKSRSLALFHALTGCDVTSFFAGKSKKISLEYMHCISQCNSGIPFIHKQPIHHFWQFHGDNWKVCSSLVRQNHWNIQSKDTRQHLFSRKSRTLENIPTTFAALKQHTLQTVYRGGHVWGQALSKSPTLLCPSQWGWEKAGESSNRGGQLLVKLKKSAMNLYIVVAKSM